jgi:hypothetical protein
MLTAAVATSCSVGPSVPSRESGSASSGPTPVRVQESHVLPTKLTETPLCCDGPADPMAPKATVGAEPDTIVVKASLISRSCRASFVATAWWQAPPLRAVNTVVLEVRDHEDPPYSGCLCFRDVWVQISGLAPGPYHVAASRFSLNADVTVPK